MSETARPLKFTEQGEPGDIGALLRREGLYSSHLTSWRQARDRGELAPGAKSKKRGPRAVAVDPRDKRIAELERQVGKLAAEDAERKHIERALTSRNGPTKKEVPRFDTFAQEFLDKYVAVKNKPSEIGTKHSIFRHHLVPRFGTKKLDQIDAEAIAGYTSAALKAKKSPQTINNHLTVLRRRRARESSLPLPHRARRPAHCPCDFLSASPLMSLQHYPGSLDDQVDVATMPNEMLDLAKQRAPNMETMWTWASRHPLSIALARNIFPRPGSNFGPSVLGNRLGARCAVRRA